MVFLCIKEVIKFKLKKVINYIGILKQCAKMQKIYLLKQQKRGIPNERGNDLRSIKFTQKTISYK